MPLPDLSDHLVGHEPPVPASRLADAGSWLDDPAVCVAVAGLRALEQGPPPGVDITEALERLSSEARWPVFSVTAASGASLHVVWRNHAEEPGRDLVLRLPDAALHTLSRLDGHPAWPGLSWDECVAFAQRSVDLSPSTAVLVLFPFVGDALPDLASTVLGGALAHAGVAATDALVAWLVEAADPQPQLPAPGPAWLPDGGARRFAGHGSLRGGAASPELRRLVATHLGSA